MRILVCSSIPPLAGVKTGDHLQVNALLDELRKRHTVRVIAPWREGGGPMPEKVSGVRLVPVSGPERRTTVRAAGHAVASWARAGSATNPRLPPGFRREVAAELEDFAPDVVHVTLGSLAELGLELQDWPSVLAPLDAQHLNISATADLYTGIRRLAWRVEGAMVRRFERRYYPLFDRVVVVSSADARALGRLDPGLALAVIPNGVDAERFSPDGVATRLPGRLVFTGVMDVAPNVTAAQFLAREILPAVRGAYPTASLAIVGRSPVKDVLALAELDGVEVVGEVPALEPWLSASSVFVCPMLSGTGIKNKLLEALANGLPCVATPRAVQGLEVQSMHELLVASSRDELVRDILRLLEDDELAESIGRAGSRYVRERHTWSSVAARQEALYEDVIAARPAAAQARDDG
jgi:glycosyltransferase involved in cell wall biosynthesis